MLPGSNWSASVLLIQWQALNMLVWRRSGMSSIHLTQIHRTTIEKSLHTLLLLYDGGRNLRLPLNRRSKSFAQWTVDTYHRVMICWYFEPLCHGTAQDWQAYNSRITLRHFRLRPLKGHGCRRECGWSVFVGTFTSGSNSRIQFRRLKRHDLLLQGAVFVYIVTCNLLWHEETLQPPNQKIKIGTIGWVWLRAGFSEFQAHISVAEIAVNDFVFNWIFTLHHYRSDLLSYKSYAATASSLCISFSETRSTPSHTRMRFPPATPANSRPDQPFLGIRKIVMKEMGYGGKRKKRIHAPA